MSYSMLARKSEAAPRALASSAGRRGAGGLRIGDANDALEVEADRVADALMTGRAVRPIWSFAGMQIESSLQRKCDCGGPAMQEDSRTMQRKVSGPAMNSAPPPVVGEVLKMPGRPLDGAMRGFFEPRLGHDLSAVRVHTGRRATESAKSVNALAYTVGNDVVFDEGAASLATAIGRRTMAHELVHVIQQGRGGAIDNTLRAAGPNPGQAATPGGNFTPAQAALLQQARASLKPETGHIVGVLIADDGRQFFLQSGGGQGFSSHIEGKATAKMNELGIKKATLLSELEPCQLCDRSDYPSSTGPETPLRSTKTGKEMARQTPKISSALPADAELRVVGPESTGQYRGTKSPGGGHPAAGGTAASGPGTTQEAGEPGGGSGVKAPTAQKPMPETEPAPIPQTAKPSAVAPGTAGPGEGVHEPAPPAAPGRPGGVRTAPATGLEGAPEVHTEAPTGQAPRSTLPAAAGGPSEEFDGAGMATAVGVEFIAAIADIFIRQWMVQHYAKDVEDSNEKQIRDALTAAKGRFDALVRDNQAQIHTWQAAGREVFVEVSLLLNYQGTDIGNIITNVEFQDAQVAATGLPEPSLKTFKGNIAGDLFRQAVNTELVNYVAKLPLARAKQAAPQPAPLPAETAPAPRPKPGAHTSHSDVHPPPAQHGFPSLQEQQGTHCPSGNCHEPAGADQLHDMLGESGALRPGGKITDADRKLLEDWIKNPPK